MDLISIIVPIYKVELYLDKCVCSIVNQSYSNLEIILVDDGSPDKCPEMCDEWAKKDSRIKVIHKDNGGLSDARNAGLQIASGDYIGFVDSDDYIREDMYELLLSSIKKNMSDISACGVQCFFDDNTNTYPLTPNDTVVLDTSSAVKAILKETLLKQPVWYKLYKKSVIENLQFVVGKYHEDVFWSYKAVGNAKSVSIFPDSCYFYRQRNDSIMGADFSDKHFDSIEAKIERVYYIGERFPEHLDLAKYQLWVSCLYALQKSLIAFDKNRIRKQAKKMKQIKNICFPNNYISKLDLKQKLWLSLSKISLVNTCKLRNYLNIGF